MKDRWWTALKGIAFVGGIKALMEPDAVFMLVGAMLGGVAFVYSDKLVEWWNVKAGQWGS